ncbi:sugar kinase [Vibrio sp. ZSDE26]|uniref:2-dehydro-3-deoxygluconokinase n=1 Tax=Vibrio amylolyticus TaxID=2847292 RepID=A0A9X1XJT9_9VIBR|nr:sugar kinase [Vibrio amylolyticus]MCK6264567.1 sugar kinase [Vibrio amylolyticus]
MANQTTSEQLNIAFFGECMVELSGSPIRKAFGGDTLNTALYLSRLTTNQAVSVSYATGLGVDELSKEMIQQWQDEGIDTTLVTQFTDKLPGLYMVEVDDTGERQFLYWRDNAAVKSYFSGQQVSALETEMQTKSIDALYISGISFAILDLVSRQHLLTLIEGFVQQGGRLIFDNNYRPQLWSIEDAKYWYGKLLPLVDIALITEDDDLLVWGDAESVEQRCLRLGCKEIVIKRGCEPCKLVLKQNDSIDEQYVAAEKVSNVVDTCAAGDSFAAGYLAARLTGNSATESAKLGHQMASIVIQHPGAIIPNSAMDALVR